MAGVPDTGGVRRLGVGVLALLCGRLRANARCWGERIGAGARRVNFCCWDTLSVTFNYGRWLRTSEPYEGKPASPSGQNFVFPHLKYCNYNEGIGELRNVLAGDNQEECCTNKVKIEVE